MPSSSSSEEDLSKFQEAADSVLYNDTLFTKKPASSVAPEQDKSEIASLPSLRHIEEEVDRIHNELRVTPSFQKHVAKHLSQFIDKQIDISETSNDDAETTNTRNILKGKRNRNCNNAGAGQTGVRLFGASAVFLSELNIAIDTTRRKKRKRKIASFSTDSSSEDSDSDSMQKLSAAAVSPDWILSGAATKGWAIRNGKVEKCTINKSGKLVSVNDDASRGYESLNEMSSGSKCSKKSDLQQVKDDLAVGKLCRKEKPLHLESELAASFSSVVSIGSDSPGDVPNKRKKKNKRGKSERRKLKKEQYSEDAATETTEVEDAVEERKKKVKKSKKKSKRRRTEEKEGERVKEVIMEEIPGAPCLPRLDEDIEPRKKKKKKKRKRDLYDDRKVCRFLRKKGDLSLAISKKKLCKKKMSRKVSHLAEDLSKLMVNPDDAS